VCVGDGEAGHSVALDRPSRKQIDRAMADAPAVAVERRAAVIPLCRVASQRLGVGWDTTVVIKATVPHHFAYTCTRNQECTAWTYDGWFAWALA